MVDIHDVSVKDGNEGEEDKTVEDKERNEGKQIHSDVCHTLLHDHIFQFHHTIIAISVT